ncbi:MAG: hypothetical protein ACHQT6_02880 [Candidatus Acidiferrales bacterium]
MFRTSSLVATLLLLSVLAGCAPQDSLFPLFTQQDKLFDKQLLGEWRIRNQTDAGQNPSEKPAFVIFSPGEFENSYDVKIPKFNDAGGTMHATAHLARLGAYLFIDLETPNADKFPDVSYPAIEAHVFGRLALGGDTARIDFLNNDWVTKQANAGKLGLAYVDGPSSTMLSAETAELRKFALEHAEDHEAFSESYILTRNK